MLGPPTPILASWPSPTSCTFAVLPALGHLMEWERDGLHLSMAWIKTLVAQEKGGGHFAALSLWNQWLSC